MCGKEKSKKKVFTMDFRGRELVVEYGEMAKQASGSVLVRYGDTVVLTTAVVSKNAKIFIEQHNKNKIITSIKHFPGHGSIDTDTHLSFADATNTHKYEELLPYYDLKEYDKLNMVMISHIFNSKYDEKYPASLSEKTIDYLRSNIGFKGVIVSDDLDMGAIKNNYTLDETLKLSINSGVNILIFSNNINTYDKNLVKKIRKSIKKQVKSGEIKMENINSSYEKVVELKRNL